MERAKGLRSRGARARARKFGAALRDGKTLCVSVSNRLDLYAPSPSWKTQQTARGRVRFSPRMFCKSLTHPLSSLFLFPSPLLPLPPRFRALFSRSGSLSLFLSPSPPLSPPLLFRVSFPRISFRCYTGTQLQKTIPRNLETNSSLPRIRASVAGDRAKYNLARANICRAFFFFSEATPREDTWPTSAGKRGFFNISLLSLRRVAAGYRKIISFVRRKGRKREKRGERLSLASDCRIFYAPALVPPIND